MAPPADEAAEPDGRGAFGLGVDAPGDDDAELDGGVGPAEVERELIDALPLVEAGTAKPCSPEPHATAVGKVVTASSVASKRARAALGLRFIR